MLGIRFIFLRPDHNLVTASNLAKKFVLSYIEAISSEEGAKEKHLTSWKPPSMGFISSIFMEGK